MWQSSISLFPGKCYPVTCYHHFLPPIYLQSGGLFWCFLGKFSPKPSQWNAFVTLQRYGRNLKIMKWACQQSNYLEAHKWSGLLSACQSSHYYSDQPPNYVASTITSNNTNALVMSPPLPPKVPPFLCSTHRVHMFHMCPFGRKNSLSACTSLCTELKMIW